MDAAEKKMIENPMDQKALDRFLQAQATYEAVGGLTQDRLVAQVFTIERDAAAVSLSRGRPPPRHYCSLVQDDKTRDEASRVSFDA